MCDILAYLKEEGRPDKPRKYLLRLTNLLWHRLDQDVETCKQSKKQKNPSEYCWSVPRQEARSEIKDFLERIRYLFDSLGIEPPIEDARDAETKKLNYSPLDHLYDTACKLRNHFDRCHDQRLCTSLPLDLCMKIVADAKLYLKQFNDESFLQVYERRRQERAWRSGSVPNSAPPKIKSCWQEAWRQYDLAIRELGWEIGDKVPADKEAYNHLEDKKESLPPFPTWSRYLREYRSAHGIQKYTKRTRHRTGRSIVRPQDI